MIRRLLGVPLAVALLVACAPAPSDDDGEVLARGPMTPAADKRTDAVPVVVDTDLAPDDLAALALLLRHPDVRVVGVTVPQTGLLDCRGTELLSDFFDALGLAPPPVACGTTPRGEDGVAFPADWGAGAMMTSGLPRDDAPGDLAPVRTPAARYIARLARQHESLRVVALGPLTEVAAVLREHPTAYARLVGIMAMAGSVVSPSHADGVAEWNAAADPVPLAEVLAGPVPLTLLPDDPVPPGAPDGLAGPVVGGLGRPGLRVPGLLGPGDGSRVRGSLRRHDCVGRVDRRHDRRPRETATHRGRAGAGRHRARHDSPRRGLPQRLPLTGLRRSLGPGRPEPCSQVSSNVSSLRRTMARPTRPITTR